jgi:ABC-type transport system involved in multi-copper enzyme maturation permease subunit
MARLAFGCLKGSLFFFNLAFFALGGVLLGLSAYSMKMGRVGDVVSVPQVALGALILAIVVVVLSFLGCCGALKESRGLIGTYFVFLLLVIAGQVIVGFVTVKYTSDVQDMVAQGWNKSNTETRQWVEQEFNCCGLFVLEHNCNLNSTSTPTTCYDKLSDFVETRLKIVQIAAISIGCVQILGLVVSCCLFASIPTKKEEHNRLLDEARRVNKSYR